MLTLIKLYQRIDKIVKTKKGITKNTILLSNIFFPNNGNITKNIIAEKKNIKKPVVKYISLNLLKDCNLRILRKLTHKNKGIYHI